MTQDELEFLISQYLDGTLDAAEQAKLQRAMATDARARELLQDHQKLDSILKAASTPVDVDSEWLAAQIAGRIDEDSARTFRIGRWKWMGPVAAAAMLMIALTLGVLFMRDRPSARPIDSDPAQAFARIDLAGPPADVPAAGKGYAAVSVGIPSNLTPALVSSLYLSDGSMKGKVSIRPAGRRETGDFE